MGVCGIGMIAAATRIASSTAALLRSLQTGCSLALGVIARMASLIQIQIGGRMEPVLVQGYHVLIQI